MPDSEDLDAALAPTRFVNADHPALRAFAVATAGEGGARDKAVRLYYAIRDSVRYDPYTFRLDPQIYVASNCLAAPGAFCVPKAILMAAVARAIGIPAQLGFADVRNHLSSERLGKLMGSDIFRWHGYTRLFIDGRWVKATPAFDIGLCERFGVLPLEFDGREDSLYHPFDKAGRRHMEYVGEIGVFDDFPFKRFAADMRAHYPHMLAELEEADRAREAVTDPAFRHNGDR